MRLSDPLDQFGADETVYLGFLLLVLLLAVVGPGVTPYEFDERVYDADGDLVRAAGPSLAHPLGTTEVGYDVLSRVVYGSRPTAIAGLVGGSLIVGIGMTVGVTAGYLGGRVDDVLMRVTDVVYGIPLIPFALILIGFLGIGFLQSVVVIGLVLWRGNARVLRSQVLQIKERPFILALKATGGSDLRIVVRHILPNIGPMATMFFALGIGYTIILQAGLAFIGVSSPFIPSWGVMVRNAYDAGVSAQPLWAIVPGMLIAFTVVSTFMVGRSLEDTGDEALVTAS